MSLKLDKMVVYVERSPSARLNEAYGFLFDQDALSFLDDFVTSFEEDFDKVFYSICVNYLLASSLCVKSKIK